MDDIEERVLRFLHDDLLYDQGAQVSKDMPLLDHMDSLALLELVSFIEEEFDLEVPADQLTPEHFRTAAAVGRFVRSLAGSGVG